MCGIQSPSFLLADESLADIACRSVHLGYTAPTGTVFYNEITVEKSAPGTYFMVCGWNTGYFGIQELGDSKKVVLFSVWDNAQGDDPAKIPAEKRVRLLHQDKSVRVGRFGGEGTGGQSFLDLDWKADETYRMAVTATPRDDRTEYAGYLYQNDQQRWLHLVTFSTITGGKPLDGYYSFVEDFRRDGASAKIARKARFGNGWVRDQKNQWQPIIQARFTADGNPAKNIDAGLIDKRFFLATGGDTSNQNCKLNETMELTSPPKDFMEFLK
ncbi:MAG: DUF3472 domain-containing protein [Pirellulales bacterium]